MNKIFFLKPIKFTFLLSRRVTVTIPRDAFCDTYLVLWRFFHTKFLYECVFLLLLKHLLVMTFFWLILAFLFLTSLFISLMFISLVCFFSLHLMCWYKFFLMFLLTYKNFDFVMFFLQFFLLFIAFQRLSFMTIKIVYLIFNAFVTYLFLLLNLYMYL